MRLVSVDLQLVEVGDRSNTDFVEFAGQAFGILGFLHENNHCIAASLHLALKSSNDHSFIEDKFGKLGEDIGRNGLVEIFGALENVIIAVVIGQITLYGQSVLLVNGAHQYITGKSNLTEGLFEIFIYCCFHSSILYRRAITDIIPK